MPAPTFICLDRHGAYLFRKVIPKELQIHYSSRKEIRKSLGTRHRPTAIKKARLLAVHTELEFDRLIKMTKIKYQREQLIAKTRAKLQDTKAQELFDQLTPEQHKTLTTDGLEPDTGLLDIMAKAEALPRIKAEALTDYETATIALELAEEIETKLKRDEIAKKVEADYQVKAGYLSNQTTTVAESRTSPLIRDIANDFISDRTNGSGIRSNTAIEYRSSITDLEFILGDVRVHTINYDTAVKFRDTLLKLPTHRNKKSLYKGKTCSELLKLDIPEKDRVSTRTVSETIIHLSTVFRWLEAREVIKSNPFKSISVAYTSNSYPNFTIDELNTFFSSPLYTPDSSVTRRKTSTAANWWLPLFALYSGARQTELVQMRIDDIHTDDGVMVASIKESEKHNQKVKTKAAVRDFPIHPKLLELGFEEYIHALQREGFERVFQGIKLGKVKVGSEAGKWFNERYMAKHLPEIKKRGIVFHSFRSTYITEALHNAGASLEHVQQMVGHTKIQMGATKDYDRGASIQQLYTAIENIKFEGLDLSDLKDQWNKLTLA